MSYVISPPLALIASFISRRNFVWTSGESASSYIAKLRVVDEVSNPPVKKIAAWATKLSPSNSTKRQNSKKIVLPQTKKKQKRYFSS